LLAKAAAVKGVADNFLRSDKAVAFKGTLASRFWETVLVDIVSFFYSNNTIFF
jgi:hypothetical protein